MIFLSIRIIKLGCAIQKQNQIPFNDSPQRFFTSAYTVSSWFCSTARSRQTWHTFQLILDCFMIISFTLALLVQFDVVGQFLIYPFPGLLYSTILSSGSFADLDHHFTYFYSWYRWWCFSVLYKASASVMILLARTFCFVFWRRWSFCSRIFASFGIAALSSRAATSELASFSLLKLRHFLLLLYQRVATHFGDISFPFIQSFEDRTPGIFLRMNNTTKTEPSKRSILSVVIKVTIN